MQAHSDIVIAGGGPVGATLALLLADSSFSVQLIEARADLSRPLHRRTLALSYGSRVILERLGVWATLRDVTPITTVHTSAQASPCGSKAAGPSGVKRSNAQFRCGNSVVTVAISACWP